MCLVVSPVHTCDWQPSLISLFIAFSSDLLKFFCQEFDNTIYLKNKKYSNPLNI